MKRFVLTLIMFLAASAALMGQTNITVSGTVTDSTTGSSVPFFSIFINAIDATGNFQFFVGVSDSAGFYSIPVTSPANQIDTLQINYTPCNTQALASTSFINVNANITYNIITCGIGGGGGNPVCDASFQVNSVGLTQLFYSNYPPTPFPLVSHSWDFGDGNTSVQSNPSHTFANAGTYNVCHIVTYQNCADTFCSNITVTNSGGGTGCDASFTFLPLGNSILFLANSGPGVIHDWIFGDGNSSSQASPNHTYASAGTYNVCHIIVDGTCTDTVCQSVTVSSGGGGGGTPCSAFFFAFPDSNQNSWHFIPSDTSYTSYSWSFGDGSQSSQVLPTHTYAGPGNYNVCLLVSNGSGCVDSFCQTVNIISPPNLCDAIFFPLQDTNAYTYTFFPLDTSYTSYQWDFGDGNSSNAIIPTHTYSTAGSYTVCLVVASNNCSDTLCFPITAGPPAPLCDATFGWQPNAQNQVDFFAGPAATYSWDFGDGNTSTSQNPTHTYSAAGTYNVCLVVSDGLGCQDTSCQQVSTTPIVFPGTVFGIAMTDSVPATDFTAYLIVYDSVAGTLTAVDTTISVNQGGFFSLMAPTGDYLVKVALNSGDPEYTDYMPTYYGDEMMWNNATMVNSNMFPLVLINMISGNNPGGPGFIGGLVSQGANKRGEGDPMEGIHVLLMDMSGNAVLHAESNHEGEFSFDNIPYGTYEVIVEMWGKTHDPYQVTISAANPSASNLGFEVNETEIVALGVTAIDPIALGVGSMTVYPNPTSGDARLSVELERAAQLDMRVLNMLGQEVVREQKSQATGIVDWQLQLGDKPEGIYFLQLMVDGKALPAQRIMIKR